VQVYCIVERFFCVRYKSHDMKNWTIFTEETKFNFGKHAGKTLDEVAQSDAPYILWCVRIVSKFLISIEDLTTYQNKYPIYLTGIDMNTGEPVELHFNKFVLQESDIEMLNAKWESYEDFIEMKSNADYDYYDNYSVDNNPFYNDNLDMDQQDPEFWDSF
jgi:hypothetical protein